MIATFSIFYQLCSVYFFEVQLVVVFGFVYFCIYHLEMEKFIRANRELSLYIICGNCLILWAVLMAFGCCENARRKFPLNYILLALLTVVMSILMGFLGGLVPPRIIILAIIGTLLVSLVLTLFAFQSKIDFTIYSGTIAAFTITVAFYGIIALISKASIWCCQLQQYSWPAAI